MTCAIEMDTTFAQRRQCRVDHNVVICATADADDEVDCDVCYAVLFDTTYAEGEHNLNACVFVCVGMLREMYNDIAKQQWRRNPMRFGITLFVATDWTRDA